MFTHRPLNLRSAAGGVAALVVLGFAGCDKGVKKVTLTGTVTYQGHPVPSGILKVVGPDSYSAGSVQSDGTFIVTDVVPGEVKVGIMESPQGSGSSSPAEAAKAAANPKPAVPLPPKYREPDTSGLVYTVTPGMTTLNIDIK